MRNSILLFSAAVSCLLLVGAGLLLQPSGGDEVTTGLLRRISGDGSVDRSTVTTLDLPEFPAMDPGRVRIVWRGHWYVPDPAEVRFASIVEGRVRIRVGRRIFLDRSDGASGLRSDRSLPVDAGFHRFFIAYEGPREQAELRVSLTRDGGPAEEIPFEWMFPERLPPKGVEAYMERQARRRSSAEMADIIAGVGWIGLIGLLGLLALRGPNATSSGGRIPWKRVARGMLVVVATGAWIWTVWLWFRDPGIPRPGRLPGRIHDLTVPLTMALVPAALLWIAWHRQIRAAWGEIRGSGVVQRRDLPLLGAVLLLAIAVQVPVVVSPSGFLDGDSSVQALSGLRILDGSPVPPFMFGRLYHGNLSGHLTALLGQFKETSVADPMIVTRGFWVVTLLFCFLTLARPFGRWVAVSATLWLAITPDFLFHQISYPEFAESLAFTSIALFLLTAWASETLEETRWILLAAFFSGLAAWSHLGALAGLGFAWLAVLRFRFPRRPLATFGGAGFAFGLGVLPIVIGWWGLWQYVADWLATNSTNDASEASGKAIFRGLSTLFTSSAGRLDQTVGWLFALAFFVVLAWALLGFFRREADGGETRAVLGATTLGVLLAFAGTAWGQPRYLVPLALTVPPLVSAAVARGLTNLSVRWQPVTLVAVMLAWSATNWSGSYAYLRGGQERAILLQSGLAGFEKAGLRSCYAPYWDAYRISFATLEKIRCDSLDLKRIGLYEPLFVRDPAYPYIPRVSPSRSSLAFYQARLRAADVPFTMVEAGPWWGLIPGRSGSDNPD